MTTTQPEVRLTRRTKVKMANDDPNAFGALLGRALIQIAEEGNKTRELDKAANAECIKLLADKMEALHMTQIRNLEAQKTTFSEEVERTVVVNVPAVFRCVLASL